MALNPDEIRSQSFPPVKKGGVDPLAVTTFLSSLAEEVDRAREELDLARKAVEQARTEVERARLEADKAKTESQAGAQNPAPVVDTTSSFAAVGAHVDGVLKAAKESADQIVADAEQWAAAHRAEAQSLAAAARVEAEDLRRTSEAKANVDRADAEAFAARALSEAEAKAEAVRAKAEREAKEQYDRVVADAVTRVDALKTAERSLLDRLTVTTAELERTRDAFRLTVESHADVAVIPPLSTEIDSSADVAAAEAVAPDTAVEELETDDVPWAATVVPDATSAQVFEAEVQAEAETETAVEAETETDEATPDTADTTSTLPPPPSAWQQDDQAEAEGSPAESENPTDTVDVWAPTKDESEAAVDPWAAEVAATEVGDTETSDVWATDDTAVSEVDGVEPITSESGSASADPWLVSSDAADALETDSDSDTDTNGDGIETVDVWATEEGRDLWGSSSTESGTGMWADESGKDLWGAVAESDTDETPADESSNVVWAASSSESGDDAGTDEWETEGAAESGAWVGESIDSAPADPVVWASEPTDAPEAELPPAPVAWAADSAEDGDGTWVADAIPASWGTDDEEPEAAVTAQPDIWASSPAAASNESSPWSSTNDEPDTTIDGSWTTQELDGTSSLDDVPTAWSATSDAVDSGEVWKTDTEASEVAWSTDATIAPWLPDAGAESSDADEDGDDKAVSGTIPSWVAPAAAEDDAVTWTEPAWDTNTEVPVTADASVRATSSDEGDDPLAAMVRRAVERVTDGDGLN